MTAKFDSYLHIFVSFVMLLLEVYSVPNYFIIKLFIIIFFIFFGLMLRFYYLM